MSNQDRKLLRAAFDLLTKAANSQRVVEPSEIITHYDGVNQDGNRLHLDIAFALGIDPETPPIPLNPPNDE